MKDAIARHFASGQCTRQPDINGCNDAVRQYLESARDTLMEK